ncbi:imidazolonepropionase [Candidatus Heimdallarchaeota archaeon]|nr:MAG: imidazolonepropionase [Candidatus Gerdarchaeota archaeon]RLI72566.1 MAG: imidazolonepropionase [Candidatus Gerdarchaeota archaeon]RLI74365.1 MAG: imidazolonepropionase [Candidatus Heimdallarchaeota archaeon]
MPSEVADLVILNANELVTLDSKFGVPRIGENMNKLAIIKNGAIAVKDGKIIFVGTTEELQTQKLIAPQETKVLDASGKLVTPGFVDPHVHLIFAGSRENELAMKLAGKTYLEILAAGGGILKTVRETRKASLEALVTNGKKILDRMLAYGTTTVEAKSGYGLTVKDEIKSLKAIHQLNAIHPIELVATFLGAHAVPPEFSGKTDEYVQLIISEMLPEIAREHLAEFVDVFCEEGIFSIEQTRRILLAAEQFGLKKIIHIDEIVDTNGAKLAAELKAVQVGHLLQSNDAGLKALAKAGVIATLLPGTPFCLMLKNYAPARKMIEYGVPIAIATDLNPNCWTESMLMILTLSCYNMKLSPAEALTAATLNAACAINREHLIGSLEVGKQADIVIFEVPNYQFLTYQFGVNLVETVIKKGKIVVEHKKGTSE